MSAVFELHQGTSPVLLAFPHTGTHVPAAIWERLNDNGRILVDPARISQAFRIALHQIHEDLKSGGALTVSMGKGSRRDFPGLEMRLEVEPKVPPSPLFRTAEAGVEWAVARKLIEMHGGEIVEQYAQNERRAVLIFLPLYV